MIETAGLQVGACHRDFGKGGLRQNLGGDVIDRGLGDFVYKADVLVFAESTREMTSRRVISGSTMASRPRRP